MANQLLRHESIEAIPLNGPFLSRVHENGRYVKLELETHTVPLVSAA